MPGQTNARLLFVVAQDSIRHREQWEQLWHWLHEFCLTEWEKLRHTGQQLDGSKSPDTIVNHLVSNQICWLLGPCPWADMSPNMTISLHCPLITVQTCTASSAQQLIASPDQGLKLLMLQSAVSEWQSSTQWLLIVEEGTFCPPVPATGKRSFVLISG